MNNIDMKIVKNYMKFIILHRIKQACNYKNVRNN